MQNANNNLPQKNTNAIPQLSTNTLDKLIDIEKERINLEKLRETNNLKEIEASEKTQTQATKLAEKELDNQKSWIENSFKTNQYIAKYIFWMLMLSIVLFLGTIIYLSKNDANIIDKLFSLIKDIAKVLGGVAMGYFYAKAGIKKNNNPSQPE